MGRHKDQEIVEFIQSLKSMGESWGFIANDEFKILDGLYWVDLTWSYREDHHLFITFEIEKEENERLLKNLYKIFDTPSSEVEKPYHHLLIVFHGTISPGIKKIVKRKAEEYNIHIIENLKENPSERDKLDNILKGLKIELSEIIKRRGKISLTNVVYDVIRGLNGIVPMLMIKDQRYPINQSTLISSSLSLVSNTSINTLSALAFDTRKYEGLAVIPIPRQRFTLSIPASPIAFDIFAKIVRAGEEIHISGIGCEVPFLFDFKLNERDMSGSFNIQIHPEEADVVQAKIFEEISRELNKGKPIQIKDKTGKMMAYFEGPKGVSQSSNEWYEIISKCAHIQKVTSQRISCPKDLKISKEDILSIQRIENILEKGEEIIKMNSLTFNTDKEVIEKLINIQENSGKISNMSIHMEQYSQQLLGEEILLGPVTWELPDIKFREHLNEIRKRIIDIKTDTPIEITMYPTSTNEVHVIYHKWRNIISNS